MAPTIIDGCEYDITTISNSSFTNGDCGYTETLKTAFVHKENCKNYKNCKRNAALKCMTVATITCNSVVVKTELVVDSTDYALFYIADRPDYIWRESNYNANNPECKK